MSIEKQSCIAYLGGEYVGGLFMHAYTIGETKFYSTHRLTLGMWNDLDYCDFSEEGIFNNYIYVYRVASVNNLNQWRDDMKLSIICSRDGNPKPETCVEDLPFHYGTTEYQLAH